MDINALIAQQSASVSNRGTITTIFGDPGVGKTTVAQWCFPDPLFIPIEQGLRSVPHAKALPTPNGSAELFNMLYEIINLCASGNPPCRTLILDSVSEFDTIVAQELCQANDVESIAEYGKGFGKGHSAVAQRQRVLRDYCENLVNYGMHIVAIAHADVKEFNPPDSDSYHRWVLQLTKGSILQWTNQVDAVIHIRNAISVTQPEHTGVMKRKIAVQVGEKRSLVMTPSPSTVTKNRFGVTKPLDFYWMPEENRFNNPLSQYYGFETNNNQNHQHVQQNQYQQSQPIPDNINNSYQ